MAGRREPRPVYFREYNIPKGATCVHCHGGFTDQDRRQGATRNVFGALAHNRCHQKHVEAIPGLCAGASKGTGVRNSDLCKSFTAAEAIGIGRR